MILDPAGREYYTLEITTTPTVSSWDASFDNGATWSTFVVVGTDGYFRWLVAGPAATSNPGGTIVLPLGPTVPKIRATSNPEVIIRDNVPTISVRS